MNDTIAVLHQSFLSRDPDIVAPLLLGKTLNRTIKGCLVSGIIVETEAYLPFGDEAAHNAKGKRERNIAEYLPAGYAYVHRSRHHHLIDIVTNEEEVPGSVLIRALQPLQGIDVMKINRALEDELKLCNGPAKLCQALSIDMSFNGTYLLNNKNDLFLGEDVIKNSFVIVQTTRIGISKNKDALLRFYIKDNPFISRK